MRNIYAILFTVLVTASVFAQTPTKMSYQAVIRNSSSQLITNQFIGMRISILQGSASGTIVYTETQTPSTNINGLVTIEIGGGTGFNTINWSSGVYFIKTETDPTGGTTYTITNTSQLLTVPFAFHAKTAENISGGGTESDPIFLAWNKSSGINITASQVSDFQTNVTNNAAVIANTAKISYPSVDATKLAGIAAGAEVNVNADWNATSGDARILNKPNIVTADGSETKVTAGTNVTVTGTGTSSTPYVINSSSTGGGFTHYIGELYGGGIVVSVWKVSGVEHGLIASLTDLSTLVVWSNVSSLIGTSAQSPINGQANTNAIIAQSGHTTSAAKLCDSYTNGGYSDWYLPAVWELNQCYNAAFIVNTVLGATNGFQFDYYWSSTESFDNFGGFIFFDYGSTYFGYKSNAYRVRAVRRF
ncbi:MAG: DUF1566 domain-containing protein [Bacteroidetes bacterium]|nr:DUF1566 domain-containing protein [Bacteroidota bacterium]